MASCKKENALDCFKSTGKTISDFRDVGEFNYILMNDNIDVIVFKGSEYKVEVVAGEHIIKNIRTKVEEGKLIIENKNTCNFVRGYKRTVHINVTVPQLLMVTNDGVATLKFAEDFAMDTLVVRNENSGDSYINGTYNQLRSSTNGNGDMYITGKANSFYVYTDGPNFVHAEGISVNEYAFLHSTGFGDCYFNAAGLQRMAYNIQSSGNIYYTGDPLKLENYSVGEAEGSLIKK